MPHERARAFASARGAAGGGGGGGGIGAANWVFLVTGVMSLSSMNW